MPWLNSGFVDREAEGVALRLHLLLSFPGTQPVDGVSDENTGLQAAFEILDDLRLGAHPVGRREQVGFENRLNLRHLPVIDALAVTSVLGALRIRGQQFKQAVLFHHLVTGVEKVETCAAHHDFGNLSLGTGNRAQLGFPLHQPVDHAVIGYRCFDVPLPVDDAGFGIAARHGKPLDIHLHEPGAMGAFSLGLILDRTEALGLQGRVAISHGFCLGDLPPSECNAMLARMAALDVVLVTSAPPSRSVPPLMACRAAGVTVLGVQRESGELIVGPREDVRLEMGDRLMLVGTERDIAEASTKGTTPVRPASRVEAP